MVRVFVSFQIRKFSQRVHGMPQREVSGCHWKLGGPQKKLEGLQREPEGPGGGGFRKKRRKKRKGIKVPLPKRVADT